MSQFLCLQNVENLLCYGYHLPLPLGEVARQRRDGEGVLFMEYKNIVPGVFLSRPNRFIAHIEIDGKEEICHVKNTGRCRELLPVGANVNFVQPEGGILKIRTYEKGVEDETFACGTGIVASSIAAYAYGVLPSSTDATAGRVRYDIRAKRDALAVDFIPKQGDEFVDVWLTGPAAYVAEIYV